jgi:hypothetical protein
MATENEHIQLAGGLARVHREFRDDLADHLGYEPTHPRVYDHLLEHYDGPLDLPAANRSE